MSYFGNILHPLFQVQETFLWVYEGPKTVPIQWTNIQTLIDVLTVATVMSTHMYIL